jgi:hypothetical protein
MHYLRRSMAAPFWVFGLLALRGN